MCVCVCVCVCAYYESALVCLYLGMCLCVLGLWGGLGHVSVPRLSALGVTQGVCPGVCVSLCADTCVSCMSPCYGDPRSS